MLRAVELLREAAEHYEEAAGRMTHHSGCKGIAGCPVCITLKRASDCDREASRIEREGTLEDA